MGVEYRAYLIPKARSFRPAPDLLANLFSALIRDRWLPASEHPAYPGPEEAPILDEEIGLSAPYAWSYREGQEGPVPFPVTADWLTDFAAVDASLHWIIDDYAQTPLRYPFTRQPAALPFCEITAHLPVDYAFDPDFTLFDQFLPKEPLLAGLLRRLRGKAEEPYVILCPCGARLDYTLPHEAFSTQVRLRSLCPSCNTPVNPTSWPATCRNAYGGRQRVPGGAAYRFALLLDCQKALPGPEGRFSVAPDLLGLMESTLGQACEVVARYY